MKSQRFILIIVICLANTGWAWFDSAASKNNYGNKLYKEGNIDDALSKWRDAQIESPEKKELYYNIGNGLHEQKKYEDAFNEYEKSLDTKDAELQRKAYYNMGNTYYRMGKLQEAIESYKKCLDMDSNDEDAKYNIEVVRKKIKENLKKESDEQSETREQRPKEVPSKSEGKPENREGNKNQNQEGQQSQDQQAEQQKAQGREQKEAEADKGICR
jgi:Ca-activated chloride channel family protein